jgi:uncharacterized SAM-binding protein YcdF (DUF218 family)
MYELASNLIVPPALPMLVLVVGLALARWRPVAGRRLAWAGFMALYAFATPLVSTTLIRAVEPLVTIVDPEGAGAIVVLSAGTERDAIEYVGETVDEASLVRIRYAAKLHRDFGLPILVTGGRMTWSLDSIAVAMKSALESDFRVPVRWIEDRSTSTAENAAFTAALLRHDGISKVLLVTEAYHMPRSADVFRAQGLEVVPAPTSSRADLVLRWTMILPRASALQDSSLAMHELVGAVWYRLSGFI